MITSKDCYLFDRCKKYVNDDCSLSDDQFCIKLFKLNYLYDESHLSMKQRMYTPLYVDVNGTDKEQFKLLKSIETSIEQFVSEGNNLYIHSTTCGNGKTAWSIRLIQAYFDAIWHKCDLSCKALFINVPRFLQALKDDINTHNEYVEHIKKHILDVDLVVWDELGTKVATPFEHEHLLNLINTRIDYNKSNIYTSNLDSDEFRERMGERLHSRIVNLSINVELFGNDKRGLKLGTTAVSK